MMIALDARAMLREEGLEAEFARTVAEAFRRLRAARFDAGVLDINIGGETSFAIADELLARGLPFVFATGYKNSVATPERFKTAPVVSKPYDVKALKAALSSMRRPREDVEANGGGS
jgi:DNA-binding NtrC family response regulator